MINAITVCDRDDVTLGDFFNSCSLYFQQKCISNGIDINNKCLQDSEIIDISTSLSEVNLSNFLFLGFAHGTNCAMTSCSGVEFLSITNNYYILSNAFVYAFSCHNGLDLADKILDNDAHVYWGYKDKAWVCTDFHDEFLECAMSGLEFFILGYPINEARNKMLELIDDRIDNMYKTDMISASYLLKNRDSIIVKGEKDMTISDFDIQ